jgi:hypothetical protein
MRTTLEELAKKYGTVSLIFAEDFLKRTELSGLGFFKTLLQGFHGLLVWTY